MIAFPRIRSNSVRSASLSRSSLLFRRASSARCFALGTIFFGACGPYALWKPPRYFSASRFAGLVIARRNQIGESIRVVSVVVAPRKFVHIERQILFVHFVIRADLAAFEQTPEPFDCVDVRNANNVLARALPDYAVISSPYWEEDEGEGPCLARTFSRAS